MRGSGRLKNVDLSGKNLETIDGTQFDIMTRGINLSNNPIADLRNLPTLPNLESLVLDDTDMITFRGGSNQPRLFKFSCLNTTLAENEYMRLMALVVFGSSLTLINGEQVSILESEDAYLYGPLIRQYLLKGFVLVGKDPIELGNPETGEFKSIDFHPRGAITEIEETESVEEEVLRILSEHFNKSSRIQTVMQDPIAKLRKHKAALRRMDPGRWRNRMVPFLREVEKVPLEYVSIADSEFSNFDNDNDGFSMTDFQAANVDEDTREQMEELERETNKYLLEQGLISDSDELLYGKEAE